MILARLSILLIILPIIISLLNLRYLDRVFKVLFIYLCITAITEITSTILAFYGIFNLWVYNVYSCLAFILLVLFYSLLFDGFLNRRFIVFVSITLILLHTYSVLFLWNLNEFNNINYSVDNSIIILLSVIYYFRIMKEMKVEYLRKDALFLINTALLIYYSGSFFVFLFSKLIFNTWREIGDSLWQINICLGIIKYIIISIGIWQIRYQKT